MRGTKNNEIENEDTIINKDKHYFEEANKVGLWQDWGRKNVKAQIANFNMGETHRRWIEERNHGIQKS